MLLLPLVVACHDTVVPTAAAGPVPARAAGALPTTIAVSGAGDGAGVVTSAPAGVTCYVTQGALTGTCWSSLAVGTTVVLTAAPNPGSRFHGWNGACVGTSVCTVTLDQATNVTATFMSLATVTFNVGAAGDGGGTVTSVPPGIACFAAGGGLGGTCWASFSAGTSVRLAAVPDAASFFLGWTGDCTGPALTCVLSMTTPRSVTASFSRVVTRVPMAFSPYMTGQDPNTGVVITESQIRARLELVRPYTRFVRTYGMTRGLEVIGRVAHERGMQVACGAWLGRDAAANEAEVTALIAAAQRGECDVAIVGNETLLRGDLTETALLAYLARVKAAVPASVLVTTADTYGALEAHPAVLAAVQAIYYHAHPYWENIAEPYAVARIHTVHQRMLGYAAGRPVVLAESGWPACGTPRGDAVPSPANASAFTVNLLSWARATGASVILFEALSEAWKTREEGPSGACWGVLDADGALRPGMAPVFLGMSVPDNWSGQSMPGGPGTPQIVLTSVPAYGDVGGILRGQVWHVRPVDTRVVVYIRVAGTWWIKPYGNQPTTAILPDGVWSCDVVTGGIDEQATEMRAYLVPASYTPPYDINGAGPLAALQQQALAQVSVSRPR